jgi:acetyl esterase/lipase
VVPGQGRRISPRLIFSVLALLVVAACAPTSGPETTGTMAAPSTTTRQSTIATTTTTVTAGNPTTAEIPDLGLEIRVPDGEGPFSSVVLVHGGGWVAGSPELMADMAGFLTDEGFLTVNTPYTLSNGIAGFPGAVDDVACAVRQAAAHPEGDGTVAVIGHSAGAHLAALVALDKGVYGQGCPLEEAFIPDRLVGLAGPYDVSRLGPLILPFFGVRPNEDPETWQAGNPLIQAGNNSALSSLLMHGGEDGLVDLSYATDFADALTEAGSEALVEVVEGARHNQMHDPDIVGDLIVAWLERG